MKHVTFELPKDDYIIADPCHVLADDVYSEIIDLYFNVYGSASKGGFLNYKGNYLVLFTTHHGGGRHMTNVSTEVLVDSSLICAIPKSLCDETHLSVNGSQFIKVYSSITASSDGKTLSFNQIKIYTDGLFRSRR